MRYKLNFQTDYGQFYLTNSIDINLKDEYGTKEWFDEALKTHIGFHENELIIFTLSTNRIKGEINVLAKENTNINFDKFDHIVESNINLNSCVLEVNSWFRNFTVKKIILRSGKYRVRVYISNLYTERDSNENGKYYYTIEVWPDTTEGIKVLKTAKENVFK
jgi:hypothetical protein